MDLDLLQDLIIAPLAATAVVQTFSWSEYVMGRPPRPLEAPPPRDV